MEGFTSTTSLDLIMGYYTIRLDFISTIILPWGKFSYMRLPMGVIGSANVFQEKKSGLMETLEYIRVYLDNLLIITKDSLEDHLAELKHVLIQLKNAKLKVNAAKSSFCMDKVEYSGYILMQNGIKPMPEKISAILAIEAPRNVKELRRFLGMVQYYRDLWERRSEYLPHSQT